MTEYNIRLNPNCASVVHTGLKFKKGDKGITFKIAVDELDTTGTTAKIVFLRTNGTSVESDISGTNGVYTYKTLGNEFAVPGKTIADVKFYSDGNRVSTASFMFEVSGDTMDGLGTGTSGYSDRLEQLVSEAEAAGKLTEQARTELEATEKDLETTEAEMAAVLQNFKEQYGEVGALNPRGDWKSDTTYQIRDTVYHNSSTWISLVKDNRKEPSDANKTHWMRSTDLQSILNGTTPAGNASKLGGLLPSEFVKIIDFGYTETDTKTAIGESGKVTIYRCVYWTDVPEAFQDAQATVITINYVGAGTAGVDQMWLHQFIISPNHEDIYFRQFFITSVGEWQKINDGGNADTVDGYHASELPYLPLTGGTLSDWLSIVANKGLRQVTTTEDGQNIRMEIGLTASGEYTIYLFNDTLGKIINGMWITKGGSVFKRNADTEGWNEFIHTGNVGSYALPITGGNLKGALNVLENSDTTLPFTEVLTTNSGMSYLINIDVSNAVRRQILISPVSNQPDKRYALMFETNESGQWESFNIHHDGNSAKVVQATSAPSDTTAVWVDTANKVSKIYKDGAWTALA